MDDTALRKECEKFADYLTGWLTEAQIKHLSNNLLTFTKQQRAIGLREARAEFRKGIMCSACVMVDKLCEARAKAWEEGTK